MLSMEQTYSRLFRPWDVREKSNSLETQTKCDGVKTKLEEKKRKLVETKRENRLRKIRGQFKKTEPNIHQDDTVSTTTIELGDKHGTAAKRSETPAESPVASLSLCCDRLLQPSQRSPEIKAETPKAESKIFIPPTVPENYHNSSLTPPLPGPYYHPGFMPEYIPDLAQALGVPPTDPLFLESIAQGYAMEMEYARILQQENEAKLLNARKQRPKKYKCPHCQVGFSNNGQLKGHIRIHTGERPYKCEEKNCGKTFTRNEELTRHRRIHSGVRPYPCATCGKRFGRRDHLKKHSRTHYLQAERMMPVFVPLSAVPQGFPYLYGY